MENLKLYFSLISGDMYYIGEDEVKNLDKAQIPLKEKPKQSCKKCYGRFYVMRDVKREYYVPCPKCLKKYADMDAMKEDPVVEIPKTTNEMAGKEFLDAINIS